MDKSIIVQNLKDAGCGQEVIDDFFRLKEKNKIQEILRLLSKHRMDLLDTLHNVQKQIDVLDFLIFNIKQNHN